jgi:hypothetical protein
MSAIDQTRGHQNNADHGRTIFFNILRTMPPALQLEAAQKIMLDLMDLNSQNEFEELYIKAHDALRPKE